MFSILQEDYVKSTVRLTLRTDPPIVILQRVSIQMRVKESLGILVLESDRVKVSQLCDRPHTRPSILAVIRSIVFPAVYGSP